jgi:site-specific DNA-methyltransferase (adenine-specific)
MAMGQNLKRGKTISTAQKLKLDKIDTNWDKQIPGAKYFSEMFRVSKHQIICGANYFPLNPTKAIICWDKKQPWDDFSQFELIWTSLDFPAKIFRLGSRGGSNAEAKIHPNQKPVKLYEFIYKVCGIKEGMKVLDTHLGSGSSRIAAERYNLDFRGVEKNEKYFNLQETRYAKYLEYRNQLSINFQQINKYDG